MVRKALPSFRATRQKRGKSDPGGISTMHGATDASEQHPESSQGRPGSLQDAPRTFPRRSWSRQRAPKNGPEATFRAPGPFQSLPGRFRMILDRSKLPQNDFSSIFRRILDVFSSIWARFGFDFLRDLVRRPARLSFRFSGFAGPPRHFPIVITISLSPSIYRSLNTLHVR